MALLNTQPHMLARDGSQASPERRTLLVCSIPQSAPTISLTLEAALLYARLGWSVIPLVPRAKMPPKGFPYQAFVNGELFATESDLQTWFGPDGQYPEANLGLVSGWGVSSLDVDSPERVAEKHFPRTPCYRTRRGVNFLFQAPPNVPSSHNRELDIQFKNAGGGHIMVPPSVADGVCREWIIPPITPLTPVPDWLAEPALWPAPSQVSSRVARDIARICHIKQGGTEQKHQET